MKSVKNEFELYEPMKNWLQTYLEDKKIGDVMTIDSHSNDLDKILENAGVIDKFPETLGLKIRIDVLGIVTKKNREPKLYFIEAKNDPLVLHDLGQLWAYCKLCDPEEAFLLSSEDLGSLSKILVTLNRTDLLGYGDGKKTKNMQVGKWDALRKAVDMDSLVPKM